MFQHNIVPMPTLNDNKFLSKWKAKKIPQILPHLCVLIVAIKYGELQVQTIDYHEL